MLFFSSAPSLCEQLWSRLLFFWILSSISEINMYANYTEVAYNSYLTVFGSAQKVFKRWILNRFLLVNSEMWIRTAIKLPHDLGVCQKTVGNSAGDFYGGGERKTPTSWIRTAIKSPTTACIWWKSLTSPWETITVWKGLYCAFWW